MLVLLLAAAIRVYEPGVAVEGYEKVPAPSISMRMNEASATSAPFITSNAWRFVRGLKKAFYEKLPPGVGALAAAEANAWGVDAVLQTAPEDNENVRAMLAFIERIGPSNLPIRGNIGIIDDGSKELPEALNLLSRRNLLYKVVSAPDKSLDLNIQIGSSQYPRSAVANPNDFAARVREQLTDDKRVLRLYGSNTVVANLTGDERHGRLHLVNYSRRPVMTDVRVRVLGHYKKVKLSEANDPNQQAADVTISDKAAEFTVRQLTTYAVVDLE